MYVVLILEKYSELIIWFNHLALLPESIRSWMSL